MSASAKEIFFAALELPDDRRAAYLDSACGGDVALRTEVESLLAAHAGAPLLNTVTLEADSPLRIGSARFEEAGRSIDHYRLIEKLGEGGFGTVFMAEQEQPVRRKVALKIIKLGMDTRQVIARFEQERQALAIMDHPNIARVFDAGATDTGRPYFVMELVRGEPITAYCDRHRLPPDERLALFEQVCRAVQHAHRTGVIHRDIKPSNLLVTVADDKPVPKIIDFGIANAIRNQLTHQAAYMSPEQADPARHEIDPRSDIYSLGVLLYELLTGTTPFDPQQLSSVAHGEFERMVREVEPPCPSARLSSLGEALASVAAQRQIQPHKLQSLVRGELDWIVMKCLEKDCARRYETAAGLASDVHHYRLREPLDVAPPNKLYRVRKAIERWGRRRA